MTRRIATGFTLIELLLVIAIVATLAAVVIPMVSGSEKSAQISVESLSTNDVFNALHYYKIKNAAYPDYFDSLIADGGAGNYSKTSKGLFDSKFKLKTIPITDTAGAMYLTSLKNAGIKNVMWHDELEPEPSVSGKVSHTLAANDLVCTINTANADGQRVLTETVPQGLLTANPAQITVVLGVGLQCRAVGTTIAAPPMSPRIEDFDKYRRYLAVFVVNGDGTAAQLKCVVNRHMDSVDHQLSNYVEEVRK